MKGLIKTIALAAALAASTEASAYTDLLRDMAVYKTVEEIEAVKVEDLKTDLAKFEYSNSKSLLSHNKGQLTELAPKLLPSAIVELEELHQKGFTPASLVLGKIEMSKIKRDCEKAKNRAKCKSTISPKVVAYLTPVANEDASGQAAGELSDYYRGTYTDEGRQLAREWASIARDKIDSYREEWRETGERPKPTFMLTKEEREAKEKKKSFFSW